jgi:hypothetical protein
VHQLVCQDQEEVPILPERLQLNGAQYFSLELDNKCKRKEG